jgi:hypothetical protein
MTDHADPDPDPSARPAARPPRRTIVRAVLRAAGSAAALALDMARDDPAWDSGASATNLPGWGYKLAPQPPADVTVARCPRGSTGEAVRVKLSASDTQVRTLDLPHRRNSL